MVKKVLGKKIGMTQIFDKAGSMYAVTVIEAGPCTVLEKKQNIGKSQKDRVALGYSEEKKARRQRKPEQGYFQKVKQPYFKHVRETELMGQDVPDQGKKIGAEIFEENEMINISSVSKGKGFQGGMNRHNWKGQTKTHGSKTHRKIGAISASADPSRVLKGRPMPGQMGNKKVTVRNLLIAKVDADNGLLFVHGSCPGPRGGLVEIKKTG